MPFYLVPCAYSYVHISFLEMLPLNSRRLAVSCSDLEWSGLVGEPAPWYLLPKPFFQMNRYAGHHTFGWTFTPKNFQLFRGFKKEYVTQSYHFYFY